MSRNLSTCQGLPRNPSTLWGILETVGGCLQSPSGLHLTSAKRMTSDSKQCPPVAHCKGRSEMADKHSFHEVLIAQDFALHRDFIFFWNCLGMRYLNEACTEIPHRQCQDASPLFKRHLFSRKHCIRYQENCSHSTSAQSSLQVSA